jgi:hemoglobin
MRPPLHRFGVALALAVFLFSVASAQQPLSSKDLDKRLDAALYDVTSAAVKLFNSGNEEGCYRMFEGALRTAIPLLDSRPDLKKRTEDRLARSRTLIAMADRAFLLREAIDDIRGAIKRDLAAGAAVAPPKPKTTTLWDRLGGESGVRTLVKEIMKVVGDDPKVNVTRGGKFKPTPADLKRQEQLLVEFLSTQTGGPLKYTGKPMKAAHAGMGITTAEFNAMMRDVMMVLANHKVAPNDANELTRIVENLRKEIVEVKAAPSPAPAAKSLWERLGGEEAVKKIVHDFVAVAVADPKVNFSRGGKYKLDAKAVTNMEKQLADMISASAGGPRKYTGKDMKAVHMGMGITEAEFNAMASDLTATLKKHNVPQKESDELLAIIAATKKDIVEKK